MACLQLAQQVCLHLCLCCAAAVKKVPGLLQHLDRQRVVRPPTKVLVLVIGERLHDFAQHRVLEERRDVLLSAEVRLQNLRWRRPVKQCFEPQIHAQSWLALCRTLSLNASACCFCCSFSARHASLRWCSSNTALFSGRCRKILKPSSCLLAWTASVASVYVNTAHCQSYVMRAQESSPYC